ncbi:MAG: hypothetical protein A2289_02590 [Deltaproteobacteria bacterium RIFOXYA12_FULL_58_15]|nr:MAG: hypothetical protein A2289_02590 [Deltaproteobacteria bacterium RIFOXYA12_FULL_58_15]
MSIAQESLPALSIAIAGLLMVGCSNKTPNHGGFDGDLRIDDGSAGDAAGDDRSADSDVGKSDGFNDGGDGDAGGYGDAGVGDTATVGDTGTNGDVDLSSFGTSVGDDPCVPLENSFAPAWVTIGRCNARTGRSPIVSSQTGTVTNSKDLSTITATRSFPGEATFAADGTLYAMGDDWQALDPITLDAKFTGWSDVWSPVVAPNGTVYLSGTGTNTVIVAWDPQTLENLWSTDVTYYIGLPTVLPDEKIALISNLSTLTVLDPTDGTTSWSLYLESNVTTGLVVSSSGMIYVGTHNAILAISPTTHAVEWTVLVRAQGLALDERSQLLYLLEDSGSPWHDFRVGSFSAVDGSSLSFGEWIDDNASDSTSRSALALGDDGWVYLTHGQFVYGVDTVHGSHWSAEAGQYLSAPVIGGDGTVYLGAQKDADGGHALAYTKTGTLRWDRLLGTIPDSIGKGASASIAPSGHLVLQFPANQTIYLLGP